MSLLLEVDGSRLSTHLTNVQRAFPGLVPVIKGNGYGFGQSLAADFAADLGVDSVAVGIRGELAEVADRFSGQVVLLEPWDPAYSVEPRHLPASQRLVLTVSQPAAVRAIAQTVSADDPVQVLLEGRTSMHRFGMTPEELTHTLAEPAVADAVTAGGLRMVGLSLHLPLAQPEIRNVAITTSAGSAQPSGRVREVLGWSTVWSRIGHGFANTLWVSHLDVDEVSALHGLLSDTDLRHRIGTHLWLGDPQAYRARATVLSVDHLGPGSRIGYRQRRAPRGARLLVVSGGTSHGIALTAPTPARTLRQRAVATGTGALDALGRALSPFRIEGKRLWFAEPPHAQVSLLWLPHSVPTPAIGDLVDVRVRMTTVRFDDVVVTRSRPTTA
jgi:hypothetical protein